VGFSLQAVVAVVTSVNSGRMAGGGCCGITNGEAKSFLDPQKSDEALVLSSLGSTINGFRYLTVDSRSAMRMVQCE